MRDVWTMKHFNRPAGSIALCLLAIAMAPVAGHAQPSAQPALPVQTIIAAPPEPDAIRLYPGRASGARTEKWSRSMGQITVRNVTDPTITPFLPDPAKATGAAVIILPGGGFQMLSMENEGWTVAKWLAARGVAAFVLKYRLNETPDDEAAMQRTMMKVFSAIGSGTVETVLREPRATDDAIAAIRAVRAGASRWKVDPARVGLLGFSAGAMTAMLASTATGADRPAFLGYVYGPMGARDVPADAPPMFAALAIDDPLFGGKGFGVVDSWNKARRPVELHAYERGGHGFGMGQPGTTTTLLMEEFYAWLNAGKLLAGN